MRACPLVTMRCVCGWKAQRTLVGKDKPCPSCGRTDLDRVTRAAKSPLRRLAMKCWACGWKGDLRTKQSDPCPACGGELAHLTQSESHVKHGATVGARPAEYQAWASMKVRCLNPRSQNYRHYGGRGISVANEWVSSFYKFFEDVGPRPSAEHSLGRIDNDGNYEPGNVEWQTAKVQANNRRGLHLIRRGGEYLSLSQLSERSGVAVRTIEKRIRSGWPEDRLTSPRYTWKQGKKNREGYVRTARSPEYSAWANMRNRCLNPKTPDYRRYGGAGVKICDRWQSYTDFLADVGPRPSDKHSLNRCPNPSGDYKPGNVRWATWAEICNNKQTCHWLDWRGERVNLKEFAEKAGLSYSAVLSRVSRNWPAEKLSLPCNSNKRNRYAGIRKEGGQ